MIIVVAWKEFYYCISLYAIKTDCATIMIVTIATAHTYYLRLVKLIIVSTTTAVPFISLIQLQLQVHP